MTAAWTRDVSGDVEFVAAFDCLRLRDGGVISIVDDSFRPVVLQTPIKLNSVFHGF